MLHSKPLTLIDTSHSQDKKKAVSNYYQISNKEMISEWFQQYLASITPQQATWLSTLLKDYVQDDNIRSKAEGYHGLRGKR